MPEPKDPIAQLHVLYESLRLEIHDAFSELHEQMAAPKPVTPPAGHDVAGLVTAAAMLEGRIKTGEDITRSAIEKALAQPHTDPAVLAALAENTTAVKALVAAFEGFAKTLGKPKKRTGVVNTPDGPLSMTITEH